jgi:hypothetical protein
LGTVAFAVALARTFAFGLPLVAAIFSSYKFGADRAGRREGATL